MKRIVRPLLVLHEDEALRQSLREVADRNYEFRIVSDWDALREQVSAAPPAAMLIVDPYAGVPRRDRLAPALSSLLREFPSLTVLAAMDAGPGCFDHVRTLGEWGVVQVICLDEERTPLALTRRLRAAWGRPLRTLVEKSLPAYTSGYARAIMGAAVDVVSVGGNSGDLAQSFHITGRTLSRWCQRSSLPPPRRLLAWMRILLASELLDDPGRTVLDVAYACGYSADASLRLALKTFLGRTPKVLRREGAFAIASREFVAALAEARAKQRLRENSAARA